MASTSNYDSNLTTYLLSYISKDNIKIQLKNRCKSNIGENKVFKKNYKSYLKYANHLFQIRLIFKINHQVKPKYIHNFLIHTTLISFFKINNLVITTLKR